MVKRHYANSPIAEAVCEFRLAEDFTWDLTIPGLVYEKVRTTFPDKERRVFHEVQLADKPEGVLQNVNISERALFLREDKRAFVQIGPNLLAVNCLSPYPSWGSFKPWIRLALEALTTTVNVRHFQRIGLRYVNRIVIPGERVELEDCFEFRPFLGLSLPQDMRTFLLGCEFPFRDERDICRVQLTTAASDAPDKTVFILDLDYYLDRAEAVEATEALDWVEGAHESTYLIFESCIKDQLRAVFGEAT